MLIENEQFIEQVKQVFHKHFTDSFINFRKLALGGGMSVTIALGKDKTEWTNGIFNNDPMCNHIFIHEDKNGGFTLEASLSIGSLVPKEKYYAMSSEKVRTRKLSFTNDEVGLKKAVAKFDQWFKALYDVVVKNNNEDQFLPTIKEVVKRKV